MMSPPRSRKPILDVVPLPEKVRPPLPGGLVNKDHVPGLAAFLGHGNLSRRHVVEVAVADRRVVRCWPAPSPYEVRCSSRRRSRSSSPARTQPVDGDRRGAVSVSHGLSPRMSPGMSPSASRRGPVLHCPDSELRAATRHHVDREGLSSPRSRVSRPETIPIRQLPSSLTFRPPQRSLMVWES